MTAAASCLLEAWALVVLSLLASVPVHQSGLTLDPVDATLAAFCVLTWLRLVAGLAAPEVAP